ERAEDLAFEVQLDDAVVLAVAHVDGLLLGDVVDAPRGADAGPLSAVLAVGGEDLDALVGPVGNVDEALLIDLDVVDEVELAVAGSFRAPLADELAGGVELDDPRVDVAVGDIDVAVSAEGDVGRTVEGVLGGVVAGRPLAVAEDHEDLAFGTELEDDVAVDVHGPDV